MKYVSLCLLLFGHAATASAQSPFARPAGTPEPPMDGTEAPATETVELDPAILQVRDLNPTNPRSLVVAAETVLNLGRPDEAKRYLAKLLASTPDEATLRRLDDQFGSALWLRFRRNAEMQPEAEQLADQILSAVATYARDQQRLLALSRSLASPEAAVRSRAIRGLHAAGVAAAPAMIATLAGGNVDQQKAVARGIVVLKEAMLEPLLRALETKDDDVKTRLLAVVRRIKSPASVPFLLQPAHGATTSETVSAEAKAALTAILGAVPDADEAQSFLQIQIKQYLGGRLTNNPNEAGRVVDWNWDAEARTVTSRQLPALDASFLRAARLADELHGIDPENADHQRLRLISRLESTKRLVGFSQPLPTGDGTAHDLATKATIDQLEGVLVEAVKLRLTGAAVATADILGARGDAELLAGANGKPRPLVEALDNSERRIQFAATKAIMQLAPAKAYAGSSQLVRSLDVLIRSGVSRRVLIAHPRVDHAQSLVGLLGGLGFDGASAQTGRQLLQLVDKEGDSEAILLSDTIDQPALGELIQLLRLHSRSKRTPIAILAHGDRLQQAKWRAQNDPRIVAVFRPHDIDSLAVNMGKLLRTSGRDLVDQSERLGHAAQALDWAAQLANSRRTSDLYQMLKLQSAAEAALRHPRLAVRGAALLGYLGTPTAQKLLVDVASQTTRPLAERQAAAKAFSVAIERRSLLLMRAEVNEQYERYNRSETLDADTQKVLGSILDAMETRVATAPQQEDRELP